LWFDFAHHPELVEGVDRFAVADEDEIINGHSG
jgi:hypothetical protein